MVFVLSCAIIFGCTAFFRPKLASFAEANWQTEENIDTISWYDELTYEDVTVYSISTAEQLAGFASLVNSGVSFEGKTIRLQDTITLATFVERLTEEDDYVLETGFEWVPIGTTENPFKGTFDAKNNVIKGLYINNANDYVGLFGCVEGTLMNINIVDSYVCGGNFVGSIAGELKGSADYCYSSATVVANSNSKKVGGLFGCVEGVEEKQSTVTNSYTTNNLSVIVNNDLATGDTSMIGGVIGCAKQNVLIENCYNRAVVKASASYVGGIVGFATENVVVSRSYNDGEVVIENKESKIEQYVGGVVGAAVNNCSITNSYNTNAVTTNSAVIGGVAGMVVGTTIENSYNSGVVKGLTYVAGVAGVSKETSVVSDCHNQGVILAASVEGYIGENFAGVIAYNNNSEVKYCYNSGEVIYFVEPVATVEEVEEESEEPEEETEIPVVLTKNVAGVVSKNEKGNVLAVYNTGIVGDNNATQVAGIVAENISGKVATSINTGILYAKEYVAGVVANNLNESTVKNCLSNAEIFIEGEEVVVGGLVYLNDENSFVLDSYFNLEILPICEAIAQNLALEGNVKNALGYNKSNMSNIKVELSDGSSCVGIIESFNQLAKKDTDSKWVASIDTNNGSSNIIFNTPTLKNSFSITEVLAIILGAIAVLIFGIYIGVYVKEARAKAAIPEFDGYGKDDIEDMEDNM